MTAPTLSVGEPDRESIWRNRGFMRVMASTLMSAIGTQIGAVALPMIAVLVLNASPREMGYLEATAAVPVLLFGVFTGTLVDRWDARTVLVVASVGRAVALASIPIAAVFQLLSLPQLYAVALVAGTGWLFFEVAHQTFLPRIIPIAHLTRANSLIGVGDSVATSSGQAMGGVLVQLLTAPFAPIVEVVGLFFSAAAIASIRLAPAAAAEQNEVSPRASVLTDTIQGVRVIIARPMLVTLVALTANFSFCYSMALAVYMLFLARDAGLDPASIGLLGALGAIGGWVGPLMAAQMMTVLKGLLSVLVCAAISASGLIIACFAPQTPAPFVVLVAAVIAAMLGATGMYTISVTLRQTLTPADSLARVVGTSTFIQHSASPLGALIGGVAGTTLGNQRTLLLSGVLQLTLVVLIGVAAYVRVGGSTPTRPEGEAGAQP